MTDFTRPFIDVLVEMINAKNPGINLLSGHITITGVGAAEDLMGGRNTTITVESTPASAYEGPDQFHYRRVPISEIIATLDHQFELEDNTDLSDLIAELNLVYRLGLTSDDFVDVALPTVENTPGATTTVKLTAKPGSYWIIGEADLTIIKTSIALSDVIVNRDLDGLTYEPTP